MTAPPAASLAPSSPAVLRAASWDRSRLIPALCPSCGRAGVHGVPVPTVALTEPPSALELGRQLHYCDLCFERRERDRTEQWAWLLGLAVFAVCTGLVAGLWGGRWSRHAEWSSLVLLWMLAVGALSRWRGARLLAGERTCIAAGAESETFLVTDSPLLHEHVVQSGQRARPVPAELAERWRAPLAMRLVSLQRWLPLPLALGTWALLLGLGHAEMRVINGGQDTLTVLIDGRHAAAMAPARFETARFGVRLALPAGWHDVALIASDGVVLTEERLRVWPGSQWLAGRRPPGQCLFVDELNYAEANRVLRHPLRFDSYLVDLPITVDSWFQPLEGRSPGAEPPEEAARWSSAPGLRHALRLLPCAP